MKRLSRAIALLTLLFCALTLAGCSDPYSRAMAAGAGKAGWGAGDKIAVYQVDQDAYVREYVAEDSLAKTPAEVGVVLRVSAQDSQNTLFVLTDAADGREIARETVKNVDFKIAYTTTKTTRWIKSEWSSYTQSKAIRVQLASPEAATCRKLAVYDPATDRFTLNNNYIPNEYKAEDPNEVGLYITVEQADKKKRVSLYSPDGALIEHSDQVSFPRDWMENALEAYFFDLDFVQKLQTAPMGSGEKLIRVDADTGRYGTASLPEDLAAASPAEVALILSLKEEGEDGFTARLTDPEDGSTVAEMRLQEGKFEKWLRAQLQDHLLTRGFVKALRTTALGGGDRLMGFEEATGRYTAVLIPKDLLATSPEEVGLLAFFRREQGEKKQLYSLFGNVLAGSTNVLVRYEIVTVALQDPLTGETVAEITVEGQPPESVQSGTKEVTVQVQPDQLADWLRAELAAWQGK